MNKNGLILILTILVLIITLFLNPSAYAKNPAETQPSNNKDLVVIMVPDLSFNEIEWLIQYGSSSTLWKTGGLGAVNLRGEGDYSYLNHAVSLGAGERGVGVMGWNAYQKGEKVDGMAVEDLIYQWTGNVYSDDELYHPSFYQLVDKNHNSLRKAEVGRFGDKLNSMNVERKVLGHSDTRKEKLRYGSLLAIDTSGRIDGYIEGGFVDDTSVPLGIRHDAAQLAQEIAKNNSNPQFTVVEWGDLHRLFSDAGMMKPTHFNNQYENALHELETFVDNLITNTTKEVWLLSPVVNNQALQEKNQLAPLWIWKGDRSAVWTWRSSTTRRDHLVANVDLVPTWLEYFGMEAPGEQWTGNVLDYDKATAYNPAEFIKANEAMTAVFSKRGPILSGYVTTLVALLLIISVTLWIKPALQKWKQPARWLLISSVSSPLWFLLTGPFIPKLSTISYLIMIVIVSGAFAVMVDKLFKYPISVTCGLFFFTITLDIINGATLTQRSFLGYDPIIGARYYGIGNEFAGVYIVSAWLMLAPFVISKERTALRNTVLITISSAMLLFLAASSLGANLGASLAGGMMIAFILYKLFLSKQSLKRTLLLLPIGMTLLLFIIYTVQLKQPESHIHAAFSMLFQGDVEAISRVMLRKLAMNWKIFKVSYWTQLFVTTYFLIGVYVWRRKKDGAHTQNTMMIQACIIASLALLIFNDSGIVAAATSMFITLSASYAWLLEDMKSEKRLSPG
ncbi:hypothetical protein [Alteribacter populi]|uniref:hypothetical protein n=1 Tax=Alteribacter populi TaxID=2011011 RepID=UPI000BBA9156|nr:hypothetical protein [Alteribacter populi]